MHHAPPRMRFELLRALYQHAERHPDQPFSEVAIAEELAVSPLQFDMVVDWLETRGLIGVGEGGALSISEAGVAEMDARGARWRAGVEAITDWLEAEKARITESCRQEAAGASPHEIALKKGAVFEARRRRQELEAHMRDLHTPLAGE